MDIHTWIENQWGQAMLGDARRNSRAIKLAEDLLNKPSASFPEQCSNWGSLKAAYRFFNEKDVSFEALQQPHRSQVIEQARRPGITLFIQDGSEIDYTSHDVELGPIGNHRGHGFCLHTTLAVHLEEDSKNILGIAHQILWERPQVKDKETRTQRCARFNEADVWGNSVKAIGTHTDESLWVNIGDRGADIFEFLEICHSNNHQAVIRMIQNRKILAEGREGKALEWILFSSLPVENFEQAHEKVKWYSMRWMIEEYHKCLKTGCGVENRNFQTGRALQAVIGMFGIIAAKLLELKYIIKNEGMQLAKNIIPDELMGIISRRYKLEISKMTLKDFWRSVAKLGGFLGRKSDGEPGWQTLWKGWVKLLTMQEALADFQKCG